MQKKREKMNKEETNHFIKKKGKGTDVYYVLARCGEINLLSLWRGKMINNYKMAGETTTQKTTQKILEFIKQNPKISRRELAEKIGISEDGIKFNLTQLKKQKKIKRIGPDKGGYWEILK